MFAARPRFVAAPVSVAALLFLAMAPIVAAQAPSFTDAAASTAVPDLQALVGATIDVKLVGDKSLGSVKVEKAIPGAAPGSVRSLTVRGISPPRPQILGAQNIVEIIQGGVPLDVVYDKKTRELAHSPAKRQARLDHQAEIDKRLEAKRARYWPEIPEEEQAQYVAEQKDFLQDAKTKLGLPLELIETRYFLFYTDIPLNKVGVYVQYLDVMYENLTKAFDFPQGKNIWRGKCPVVAFQNKSDFMRFEADVMQAPADSSTQGRCHNFGDGRVVMACYKGDSESFFACVLVHETSHGFIHRYKSSVHIPPWINEGIADWVAGTVVGKFNDEMRRRQFEAVDRIRQSGTLGGSFFGDDADLDRWQYGTASSLVEMLLRIDPKKYRKLIDNVKEGMESEDALRDAYGFGYVELTRQYGALARVPNLQP